MSLLTAFAMEMGVCSLLSGIAILVYWVWICTHQKLRSFQTFLICMLLVCEIGTILSSIIQYGVTASGDNLFLCRLGRSLFTFFTCGSFLLSMLLVTSLLHLSSMGTRINMDNIMKMNNTLKYQAIAFFSLVAFDIVYTVIIHFTIPEDECEGKAASIGLYWGLWMLAAVYNLCGLGFIFYNLNNVSKALKKDGRYFKVVLAVALVIGVVRFPAFILGLAVPKSASEIFADPNLYGQGVFVLISHGLSTLQGFFVVITVGYNQGLFSFCQCGQSLFSHNSTDNTSQVRSSEKNPKSTVVSEAHDMDVVESRSQAVQIEIA